MLVHKTFVPAGGRNDSVRLFLAGGSDLDIHRHPACLAADSCGHAGVSATNFAAGEFFQLD